MKVEMRITKAGPQIVIHGPDIGQGLTAEQVRSAVAQATALVHRPEWWEAAEDKSETVTLEV